MTRQPIDPRIFLPSGSTQLNLHLSGHRDGAYPIPGVVNMIGDTFAGKTYLLWAMYAEVNNDPAFNNIDLYYDDAERGLTLPVRRLFGKSILDRVISSKKKEHKWKDSRNVEDFGRRLEKIINKGRSFVYGLDSFDGLSTESERKRTIGKKHYPEQPKILGEILRRTKDGIEEVNGLLFIISQVRDNINVIFGNPFKRSGGRALHHYSTQEIWLFGGKALKKHKMEIGHSVTARASKNRITGIKGSIRLQILSDYGIDDLGSMVDWCIDPDIKIWKGGKSAIQSPWGTMKKQALIKHIEKRHLENKLIDIVEERWIEIINSLKATKRRRRYN